LSDKEWIGCYPLFLLQEQVDFFCMEGTTISDLLINEQIRDKEVRVIGEDGEQLGVMSIKEAMDLAEEAGVDLIKIAPTAKPPVCKIADYGKYKYEQMRREKEAKKKQKVIEIKEIRLSPNIDTNDLNTKANAARKFLTKGDKVKVSLRFRGREMAHMNSSKHILDDFAELLADVAVIDKAPKVEGRSMTMFLTEKR
jgi:translation initiation factor IF-3